MHAESLVWTIPPSPHAVLVFAHGAGAGPDSQFMQSMADALSNHGIVVGRVEFPYWSKIRETGKKRPPDRAPVLDQCFAEAVASASEKFPHLPVWVGGKSMGARVALRAVGQSSSQLPVSGWIGFGFPFHPPGKPERNRLNEMTTMPTNSLIIQGTKDPFGNQIWVPEQVRTHAIRSRIHWVEQAGHDLNPPKSSGISAQEAWQAQAKVVAEFIAGAN